MNVKQIISVSAVSILVFFLFFVIVFLVPRGEDKVCAFVDVTVVDRDINKFITEAEVYKYMESIGVELIGKRNSDISLDYIEKELESHIMLGNVSCYFSNNGNVYIRVEQKEPVFRVLTNKESYYVDSERMKMPVSLNHVVYVPLVSGNVNSDFATVELFDFIVYLQDDKFMRSLVEQIYVYPDNKVELIPRVGAFKIHVGHLDRYQSKIHKLKIFYEEVLPEVGWDKYKAVNLEFVDQVVASR